MSRSLPTLLCLLLLLRPGLAARADDDDHERVRHAFEAGEVVPLRYILSRVPDGGANRLLEAELEHEDGNLVYQIKLLTPAGRVLELLFDARTGEPVESTDGARGLKMFEEDERDDADLDR